MQNKKILFILPSLKAGGAERVISFVSNNIDKSRFESKLVVIGFEKDKVYNIDGLDVEYLNKTRLLTSVFSLFKVIKNNRPNVVVSSIGHVNVMMGVFSIYFKCIKFIGREASVVSKRNEFGNSSSLIISKLMYIFYARLSAIICQSSDMKEDFQINMKMSPDKLKVIHNPITKLVTPKVLDLSIETEVKFITVGRLSKVKGHQRVLEALSKVSSYKFSYCIIGSGPLETELKNQVIELGLSDSVTFIPFTSKVLEFIKDSDYFLQGSFVEGFPNALLESCTVGVPVIVFDAPGGTKDIVLDGINGFTVSSSEQLISLLNNREKLKSIQSKDVLDSVISKFASQSIIKKYEELFDTIINE